MKYTDEVRKFVGSSGTLHRSVDAPCFEFIVQRLGEDLLDEVREDFVVVKRQDCGLMMVPLGLFLLSYREEE